MPAQQMLHRTLYAAALILTVLLAPVYTAAAVPTEDPPPGPLHPLLSDVIKAGPYAPRWASLITHPMPAWFGNDKIGLSAHWGPYAVPGWTPRKDTPYGVAYAEWYWQWMKSNAAVKEYHKKQYGDAAYDDFIDGTKNLVTGGTDGFFAENFDADRWMKTFKQAGVRYFFITSKHHDGFCLWDTRYTDRNAMKMGPKRDLYGELTAAARRHGLRIGLYYSFYEWNNPIYRGVKEISSYKGCKKLRDEDGDGRSSEYVDDFMIPQIKELIDKYHPDYLCFDGEWEHGYMYWRARQIIAYYYNQAARRGQEVVMNDRYGQAKEGLSDTRGVYGDFKHVEYYANVDRSKPWAMWRGFGNSYGYNRNEHPDNILSREQVVRMLIDVVCDNGNLEFNIGPKADGTIAAFERDRLAAMGEWLSVNGEAIYGTRKGVLKHLRWGRSTTRGNTIYLHVFNWPTDGMLQVQGLMTPVKKAYLLHDPERKPLNCTSERGGGLTIDLTGRRPFPYASCIALAFQAKPVVNNRIFPDQRGRIILEPGRADLTGGLQVESADQIVEGGGKTAPGRNIGFWTNKNAAARWEIQPAPHRNYEVTIEWACAPGHEGGAYTFSIAGTTLRGKVATHTSAWQVYHTKVLGRVRTSAETKLTATLRALKVPAGKALMNIRRVILTPVKSKPAS